MELNDAVSPLVTQQILNIIHIVLKQVFSEHGRARRVVEHCQLLLPVFLFRQWLSCLKSERHCSVEQASCK